MITCDAPQFLDCRNSKTYEESNYILIWIRSRALQNQHGHTSRVARISPSTPEQGDGGTIASFNPTSPGVVESMTGLLRQQYSDQLYSDPKKSSNV
ncbi:S2-RNase [Pyrus ussuriensis x Pyrus communis]|uniref:S2-RNase n=1 Tax=Pyrus ussuriensis x Pyrus communis TaxID=2448454 RepID=A0A5N5FJ31_9ROSA|nr:S2-RNase [Pyrus ussuriensis x Pyrus communis]